MVHRDASHLKVWLVTWYVVMGKCTQLIEKLKFSLLNTPNDKGNVFNICNAMTTV